ncbi:MAG: pseudoazurin [Geminicoccaceae bacterium]
MLELRLPSASLTASLCLMAAASLTATGPALATAHEIRMLNKGAAGIMVFEPAFLEIAPGDTVHFRAVNKGHNAASIDGMIPDGAAPWKGGLSKDVDVTFAVEGVYGVRCVPHYAMGMVALIAVGNPSSDLEAASQIKHPGKAKSRMAELLARLE